MAFLSETNLREVYNANRFDSEYFLPQYIENESILSKCPVVPIPKHFFVSDGNHLSVAKHFSKNNSRVPYFRGQDINSFYLNSAEPVKIPEDIFQKPVMHRSHFLGNDVLLSIVGTIGSLSIVPENFGPATGSCKIAILRSKGEMDPHYLSVFLLTKYGQLQVKRNTRGAVQMGLILEDIVRIRVPNFDINLQREIGDIAKKSIEQNNLSISLYTQAQELLERELGLDKLVFDKPLSYEAELSEVVGNNRADAEYFHAKYVPLLNLISFYGPGCLPLFKLATEIIPNINLQKETGDYDYIEIGDIAISDGSYTKNRINVKDLPANAKIKLSGGEIIISQVRPTRGAISIISDELDYPTLCSGAFYTCRINDISYREIIWLYIRSIRGIFEKFCGGTSYPTIDSHYVSKLMIPIFERSVAEKIKKLIIDSKKAKNESQLLLEQAKSRVEQLIEEAVEK